MIHPFHNKDNCEVKRLDLINCTLKTTAQRFRPPQKNNGQKSQNYILLASGSPH